MTTDVTKHKQLCTIVIIRCYHRSLLLWVSFLKANVLKIYKWSSLLFILVLKWEDDWFSLSVLPIRSFHIAGPLMEIRTTLIPTWKWCWIRMRRLLKFFKEWWRGILFFIVCMKTAVLTKFSLYSLVISQDWKSSL